MRKRRNSWLFEGKDGEAGEEMEFEDAGFEEDIDVDAIKSAVEDLAAAVGMEASADDMEEDDEDMDLDLEDEEGEDEDMDLDLEEGMDEVYESMNEADDMDEDECSEDDEIVEVNEAMLRRALGATRRRSTSSRRVNESRRARIARARRRRRLAEGEAKSMASQFGGGKLGKEMFVDVDENTLLNALAEELGSYGNATANQGQAAKMAGHFGGGSVSKSKALKESRRVRRQLAETKRVATKNARVARAAKKELKESNLFNAKLLYVTKLMQQHTLNNKQQRAIIEAMDNAETQREAKLLFTSLNESLNKRQAQKLQESRKRQTINESRTTYSNRSLQSGQAARGNAVELDRWAVLAGIKK